MDSEQRRHPREDVYTAIMVSPNGHEHRAAILNLSESGARMGLPEDFERGVGTALRMFFALDDDETVVLYGHVVRVAIDHLGVEFNPCQEDDIRYLMKQLPRPR